MDANNADKNVAGKYLTLALGDARYGVEILKVQEIIRMPQITFLPKCAQHVRGVINLRGAIIPVIELRTRLDLPSVEYDGKTCVIVLNLLIGDRPISLGIIVDTVVEVVDYEAEEIAPPPEASGLSLAYVLGVGKKEKLPLCILLDMDKLHG